MIIINAENQILGRIATQVAKHSLLGEEISIINCEKAVISGSKENIISKYRQRRTRGIPTKGPHFPRMSDSFVKRTVRGMLPYKQPKGRDAFKRVKCYSGVPKDLEGKEYNQIESADVKKLPQTKYVAVGEICKALGGRS